MGSEERGLRSEAARAHDSTVTSWKIACAWTSKTLLCLWDRPAHGTCLRAKCKSMASQGCPRSRTPKHKFRQRLRQGLRICGLCSRPGRSARAPRAEHSSLLKKRKQRKHRRFRYRKCTSLAVASPNSSSFFRLINQTSHSLRLFLKRPRKHSSEEAAPSRRYEVDESITRC